MEWNGWLEALNGEDKRLADVVPTRTNATEKSVPKEAYKYDSYKRKRAIQGSGAQKFMMSSPITRTEHSEDRTSRRALGNL